ncbi:DNA damage-responsive repressor GIS1/RPH1, jumonji superfamily [Phaffia rhodozyma]|uniref:[histone H3]-trimethyl-L-lysine(9) demethylase n=1 Tax=Phaffia rhodozyma TaxID=264483 RepID=A0A0F7STE3_PHARH|nr:DNA damage-responsive repressor GIS1/RPH1, jumonji superfamily [Phaffia rhodozyma]
MASVTEPIVPVEEHSKIVDDHRGISLQSPTSISTPLLIPLTIQTQADDPRNLQGHHQEELPELSSSSSTSSPASSQKLASSPEPSSSTYISTTAPSLPPPRKKAKRSSFVQPSFFYPSDHSVDRDYFDNIPGCDWDTFVDSEGVHRRYMSPEDDEEAKRGIPVFKPDMKEFADFEAYMDRIDHWGRRSGIVKVIPPKEWIDKLPTIPSEALARVKIKSPIQQHMKGRAGLFRVQNVERKKPLSVKEWYQKCALPNFATPLLKETDRSERPTTSVMKRRRNKQSGDPATDELATKPSSIPIASSVDYPEPATLTRMDEGRTQPSSGLIAVSASVASNLGPSASSPTSTSTQLPTSNLTSEPVQTQITSVDSENVASVAESVSQKEQGSNVNNEPVEVDPFYDTLLNDQPWLPRDSKQEDFTPEVCKEIERKFWRGLGLGDSAWYGADLRGSLFTDETKEWNVAHLPNLLNRLKLKKQLPGVNTPYLYWGMWRASFAWHVEDMDLYSVNYLHFGSPKCWYAIPQARAEAFERVMKGYFPSDHNGCDQFLRHKSFTASPSRLALDSCQPNVLVQHQHEYVFTYPKGYHAGFNMGFNCAESINFAMESWVELGRRAKVCQCVSDSVKIDVDAVLAEHELLTAIEEETRRKALAREEKARLKVEEVKRKEEEAKLKVEAAKRKAEEPKPLKKRKPSSSVPPSTKVEDDNENGLGPSPMGTASKQKRVKLQENPKPKAPVVAKPKDIEYPCILCPSLDTDDLLPVGSVPSFIAHKSKEREKVWYAHTSCAYTIPETYFVDVPNDDMTDSCDQSFTQIVQGIDLIPKDRWSLNCAACTKPNLKKMGGKVQCTKGKCPRAFHVTCALNHPDTVLREQEVVEWTVHPPDESHVAAYQAETRTTRTELLCSTHNPATRERKKLEAAAKLRELILGFMPSQIIRVKGKSGNIYAVSFLAASEQAQTVTVHWVDGRLMDLPWSSVLDPIASLPKPKKERAATISNASRSSTPVSQQLVSSSSRNSPSLSMPAPPSNPAWGSPIVIDESLSKLLEGNPIIADAFRCLGWSTTKPVPPISNTPYGQISSAMMSHPSPVQQPIHSFSELA